MSRLWIFALALGAAGSAAAVPVTNATQKVDYTGHSILSIVPETSDQLNVLFRLENEMELDFWAEAKLPGSPAVVRVAPEKLLKFTEKVSEAGMTAKIEVKNVQKLIDDERHEARFTAYSSAPLRFQRYLKNEEFEKALMSYSKKYDHVEYTVIGKSYEGRDIIGVHITKGKNKPIIFFECGIHAREWVAHATCLYIIDQLATMYEKDETIKRLVDEYEWRIHPVVNPDGYVYTHTSDRMWRKTRSVSKKSKVCLGADANRNFDVGPFCGEGLLDDGVISVIPSLPFFYPHLKKEKERHIIYIRDQLSYENAIKNEYLPQGIVEKCREGIFVQSASGARENNFCL